MTNKVVSALNESKVNQISYGLSSDQDRDRFVDLVNDKFIKYKSDEIDF